MQPISSPFPMSSLVLLLVAILVIGAGTWGVMRAKRARSQGSAALGVGIVVLAFVVLGALGTYANLNSRNEVEVVAMLLALIGGALGGGFLLYRGRRRPTDQPVVKASGQAAVQPTASSPRPPSAVSSPAPPAQATSKSRPALGPRPSAPMLFLSYRRNDSADVTGRIYDRLVVHFGKPHVFKDVDSIALGLDFRQQIADAVGQCQVVLAVVGKQWHGGENPAGADRLQDPRDFVRIEIESAIERHIPVIPVLVQGASVPVAEALPPSLRDLGYRHAIQVRSDPDFHTDIDRLIKGIEAHLASGA